MSDAATQPTWRSRILRGAFLALLAGVAEASVVLLRARPIAEVDSWGRLWGMAFGAGAMGAFLFFPGIAALELAALQAGRFAARGRTPAIGRVTAAVLWGAGGLAAALWVMSWYERFHAGSVALPLAVAALGLVALAWITRSPKTWIRRAAGASALAGAAAAIVVDARTAFGQYPTFHVAVQWLVLLVAAEALRALGPIRWPGTLVPGKSLVAATACAAILMPLHWEFGPTSGTRGMVRGLGWMTLPRTQLFHEAPLNPGCSDPAALAELPEEARAAAFLKYAHLGPLRRDLGGRNFVLLVMDAVRADRLAAYGGSGLTPNLDALGESSVVFGNAYGSSSGTIGTVGAMFCLSPPSWTEMTTQQVFWRAKLRPECTTIAERLAARGYRTRSHLHYYVAGTLAGDSGYLQGFESVQTGKTDAQVISAALEDLRGAHGTDRRPSFLWIQLGQAHHPYVPSPPFAPKKKTEEARYDAAVRSVDAAVGDLVRGLKQQGLWRKTVLVVMSDHGEEFGEHGGWHHNRALYDESIRVPLLVHDPRVRPRRVEDDVSVSDLGAWLLWERRGVPDPDVVARVASSAGRLYGALGDVRVSELLSNTGVQVSLVRGPRKAVRNLSGKYDELYDRTWDPGERRNLVESEPGDELIADLDRYEAIRRCTRRAQIMPIRGGATRSAAAK